eukprot:scaffold7085_cov329-Pinguiococcus_pyrenoidosus.AAC.4
MVYAWGSPPEFFHPDGHISPRAADAPDSTRVKAEERQWQTHSHKSVVFEVHQELQIAPPPRPLFVWERRDWFFFAGLVGAGLALTLTLDDDVFEGGRFMGELIFAAGFTPFVLSVWALLTGVQLFRNSHIVKMVLSAVLVGIGGVVLVLIPPRDSAEEEGASAQEDDLRELFGRGLFEIGTLFFVTKLCLLEEDEERRIARLETSLQEALESPATGLAFSYFYNFVRPTAGNLRRRDELHDDADETPEFPRFRRGDTPVDMEISRGKFERYACAQGQLFILLPRNLTSEHNIKSELVTASKEGLLKQGRPTPRAGDQTHRPMFVYFLDWDEDFKTCTGVIDIPTVVSSIVDRAEAQKSRIDEASEGPPPVEVWKELLLFQNKLLKLIAEDEITRDGRVRILSIPSLPFNFGAFRDLFQEQIAASSKKQLLHATLSAESLHRRMRLEGGGQGQEEEKETSAGRSAEPEA